MSANAIVKMPTREEWLGQRRTILGGTDMAKILSGKLFEVWASKVLPKSGDDAPPAKRLFWGKRLEKAIAEGYAELRGVPVEWFGEVVMRHPDYSWWGGSPDFKVITEPKGGEVKNRSAFDAHRWGEPGTDDIPDEIATQTFHYMPMLSWPELGKSGADSFDVIVLFGGNDERIYTIQRDPEIEAVIAEKGDWFWRTYVLTKTPPPPDASPAAGDWLKRRFPKNVVDIRTPNDEETELLRRYELRRLDYKIAKEEKDALENQIKLAIGDGAGLGWGKSAVTWKKAKDSEKTDHETALEEILSTLPAEHAAVAAEIIKKFTFTVEGTRRFYWPEPRAAK